MAMPKKGSRKIVVDGKEYQYRVKPSESGRKTCEGILTVQINGRYLSKAMGDRITPAMVEKFIKDIIIPKRAAKKVPLIEQIKNNYYTKCLYELLCDARKNDIIDSETFRASRGTLVNQPENVENLLINVGYFK